VIDTDGYDIAIAPRFVGTGRLTKVGAGALTLTGTNIYSGATQVDAGRLEINGDQSGASGLTTVNLDGVLGGTGVVGGDVDVAGGSISPGSAGGPGTLTINGDLVLDAASRLNYRLGQAGAVGGALNDLLVVHGDLTLDGVLNVTQSAGGTFGPGAYRLINYDGTLHDQGLSLGVLSGSGTRSIQTAVANQVNLVFAAPAAGGGGGVTPGEPQPPKPVNFWDGPSGVMGDGVITGGDGVWKVGGAPVWSQADGAANGTFQSGTFAVFSAAPGVVTVDNSSGAVAVSGMQFAADGYTVTGGAIGLVPGEAIVRVGDGSAQGEGFMATIASELTGPGQLNKTDLGTLVLTGANSYAGGARISSGVLQLGDGGTTGAIQGDVTADGVLAFNRSDATTFRGAISGAGQIRQIGSGVTTLSADSSAFAGRTEARNGTLTVDGKLGGAVEVFGGARLTGTGQVGSLLNQAGGSSRQAMASAC
jgi:fibronectin-binding autotransporter adhesin